MAKLKIGDKAPDFKGVDQNNNSISLSDFIGKKVILYFYPKANTPGCTAQACNLRDNYDDLLKKGFKIIGVSADSVQKQNNFASKYQLPFPLIADTEKEVLKLYGAWGEKKMYGRTFEGIIRMTYVIDEKGIIEQIFNKVKTKEHSEQILEAMKQ
ncbi:MAG: thioredoxin-dependent thiol peroxidase [Bacteroidales bacterium]|jgi:peroxiredoxin Q/BCP|nr:thioredoxin-dependent thiol peroxidase [Bacteroidales bacterium]MDI9593187.1 thioredoxin-dependent thiol peroxidase [Bacteroidota bacterium]NLH32801.1 thioredoxin-dependent thiol peroxidase [Lentimicrobium sp.]MBP7873981.1 thioredoxin-dependent thiol peroxidase [Bacteroidales bacterium]MCO6467906.1 thioredoxin-dependent thiol peroxidase [Bacteroidales bacterium]